MRLLILASLFFLGLHFGVAATPLRDRLIERFGPVPYRIGFAVSALLGLVFLVYAWRQAPFINLWGSPAVFRYLAVALMPLAFFFIVAGLTTKNPARLGQEGALTEDFQPIGILRITRNPVLWGIALWALLHLLANGDVSSVIFFATFLVLAVGGSFDIDRKRLRQFGEHWRRYMEQTSNLPFQAILQGRQKLVWQEIGWGRIVLALVLYFGFLHGHARLFGVSPLGL
ncbi:hypothetical protein MIT9_P0026 [Methylomarinovum caldicuralii]|uniref:NnrU domain-containing protein n=1 Tax=Methylomarinovum caldicuralii TaxID=438856 RepID=A0AAU9CKU6_9GAMM|nr:NnrU family protein [Methylomarinovum caldicuralii]BCX80453.1 hypothetical protein MIT9_P0026 [Methylomarinovum caldicuralii]